MQEFKLDRNKFRLNYAELIVFQVKIAIGIALIAFLLSLIVPKNHWLFDIMPYIYALIFMLSIFYERWDQHRYHLSYRLQITDKLIVWKQGNDSTVSIKKANITQIQKIEIGKNQTMYLIIMSEKGVILVPAQIEQYDEVVELLAQIHPITTKCYSGIRGLQNKK